MQTSPYQAAFIFSIVRSVSTIMNKIFETNCSFHVKYGTPEKFNFYFSRDFFDNIEIFSFWDKGWVLDHNFLNFGGFLDFFLFPKILSLQSFGNLCGNSFIPCLLLIIMLRFSCGEKELWWKIRKTQNKMTMNVCKLFFCFLYLYQQPELLETVVFWLESPLAF